MDAIDWSPRAFWRVIVAAVVAAVVVGVLTIAVGAQDDGGALDVDVQDSTQQDDDPGNVESVDDLPGDLSDSLAKDSPFEQWQIWSALIIPWLLAVVNRRTWGKDMQTLAMVAVSVLVALVGSYVRGELDNVEFSAAAIVAIVVLVQIVYRTYAMLPGVGDLIRWIEEKTGGTPADVARVDALGVPPIGSRPHNAVERSSVGAERRGLDMPGKTDAWESEILNYVFRGQALAILTAATTPASVWAALWIGDPTDTGAGGAEASYTSYARVAISRATGSWTAPADASGSQRVSNSNVINWPASTGGAGQTVTHIAYMSALTGGTMIYSEALAVAQTVTNGGSAPSAAIGALTIAEG